MTVQVLYFINVTPDENLVVCGAISDKDILFDILNKKSADSSNQEDKVLDAEEMLITSSSVWTLLVHASMG